MHASMSQQSVYLYGLIIGCEAAFWVVLAAALAARYLLKRARLSRALLLALPVVDLLLLAFTALDLRSGTPAAFAHGLATAYVGFTLPSAESWSTGPINTSRIGLPAVRCRFLPRLAAGRQFDTSWRCGCVPSSPGSSRVVLLSGLIAFVDQVTDTQQLYSGSASPSGR